MGDRVIIRNRDTTRTVYRDRPVYRDRIVYKPSGGGGGSSSSSDSDAAMGCIVGAVCGVIALGFAGYFVFTKCQDGTIQDFGEGAKAFGSALLGMFCFAFFVAACIAGFMDKK